MDTKTRVELWQRLSDFEFDDPEAERPFSTRLADEQGWSSEYADRVISEYRRFVFLSQIAPHKVTPSQDVDAVWHLHLLYTESYWDGLGALLDSPLHHHPSTGGPSQDRRHEAQYCLTLTSYEHAFGEPAPTDIWPRGTKAPKSSLLDRFLRRARQSPPEPRFDAFHDPRWGRVGGACGGCGG